MKIKITIIEIEFPGESEEPAYTPEPPKPFSEQLRRVVERIFEPTPLLPEHNIHGPFLTQ